MDGRKMGCMGDQVMESATPTMDKLAENGVLFENAYSNCPVCNPSRASMWSGKYPHYYECWNNHEGLTDEIPTFIDRLEETDYITNTFGPLDYEYGQHSIRDRVGSWTRSANIHRPLSRTSLPRLYDEKIYENDENIFNNGIEWMKEVKDQEKPFMLYLTTGLVHPAFNAQRKYLDKLNLDKIKIPPGDETDHPVLDYQWATKNCNHQLPEDFIYEIRKTYLAMIATLDEMLGNFLDTLREMGLQESTYIIFTSDHGEMAGEHNQILKRTMYEPSVHEPLIITGPDVRKGNVVETPVSLIDIFPTLMDMAEVEDDYDLDGESLMPILKNKKNDRRDWVFSEYHGDRCNTGAFMLRKDEWKYIHYVGFKPLLFNLEEDPWEINNLAEENSDLVAEFRDLLYEIVDVEEVDRKAKKYDKENFRKWRQEHLEKGDYNKIMATVYSGFDRLAIEDIIPWREEDEKQIKEWLDE